MENPELARYKILQGILLQSFEAKDPVADALEAGITESDLPLLEHLGQDRELMALSGPQKWLPNLARDIHEALTEEA